MVDVDKISLANDLLGASSLYQISRVICYTRLNSGEHANVVIRDGRPVALLESVQLAVFVFEKSVVRTFQG